MNKFGYTKIEIMIIVVLLGIVAFITINKTSYAFAINDEDAINDVKNLIELQAEEYALDNLDVFKETNTTFILVDDLVKFEYLIGDSKGLITDPTDPTKNFNNLKIKLVYDDDKSEVEASLVS